MRLEIVTGWPLHDLAVGKMNVCSTAARVDAVSFLMRSVEQKRDTLTTCYTNHWWQCRGVTMTGVMLHNIHCQGLAHYDVSAHLT